MLRFHIPNMTCGGCAKGVTATLREAAPAAKVEIALDRREVSVDAAASEAAAIERALRDAGWEAAAA
ncbi:heavy-metal-associated domain-containing protein [Falsiroseomonas sp. CW058]|uniref:heavy-metal-associated domain-containing protein n=1 Tax=Falsiroseomonas sp. CW058 TaxID=3388664 RepID=UPI003D31C503